MPRKKRGAGPKGVDSQLVNALANMAVSRLQPAGKPAKKRKRRRKAASGMGGSVGDGTMSLSRAELLETFTLPANNDTLLGSVDLIPDSFSFLKGVAASFDRIRWNSLRVWYKPAVGTTYGGLVSVGMDWDWAGQNVARKDIPSYTPNFTLAVHADSERNPMVLPSGRLQNAVWYQPKARDASWSIKGPGKLHYALVGEKSTSAKTLGELWVHYSVTMMGTNPGR